MKKHANTGTVARLREFFAANPGEELSLKDIMAKFGCSYSSAKHAAWYLMQEGTLASAHVYRAAVAQGVAA